MKRAEAALLSDSGLRPVDQVTLCAVEHQMTEADTW